MRRISHWIALLTLVALVAPVSVVGSQLPQQQDEDAPRMPWQFHDLPIDPITGLPIGLFFLGQDGEGDDEDESDEDWDGKDLPLNPDATVSFSTTEGSWMSVDVSPDGSTVVFDLLGDLYTVPLDGGAATRITDGLAWDAMPAYSPDGEEILFVSDRSGSENLWTVSPGEEDEDERFRQVTKGGNNNFASPTWTPDGEYVVASRASGNFGTQKLHMIHAEQGGSGFQLTREPAGRRDMGAAVSPDGRWVWYAYRTGAWTYNAILPQYQLAVYDRETGETSVRTSRHGSAFRPALSPDGNWMAYGTRHEEKTGLRLRDLRTGDESWLAYPVQRDDQESLASRDVLPGMAFTPDSTELVASYGGKIWRIPVTGGDAMEVPFTADVELEVGSMLEFEYPVEDSPEFEVRQIRDAVPSPDGSRLAFTALDRLYLMDWPDGTPQRATSHDFVEAQPIWSPDGESVAFVTWDEIEGGHIYEVPASGGAAARLTTQNGTYQFPAWSPDGERIVAVRGPARAFQEATGAFASGAANDLVWIPAAGGDWTLISPLSGRGNPHFGPSSDRIYMYGRDGLVSIRWDGTDQKEHLKVTGPPIPGFSGPPPRASWVRIAPTGDKALARVGQDLYSIETIPMIGEAPTISVASPGSAPVPVRKLTDIGGEFQAWGSDGTKIHWSIGNAHVVYDLAEAQRVDDEVEAEAKRKAKEAEEAAEAAEEDSDEAGDGDSEEGDEPGDEGDDEAEDEEDKSYKPFEKRVVIMAERDVPDGTVALTGARIVTMNGDEVFERGDVVVSGARIVAVGATGSVDIPSGAERIDMTGKTIVPGFVDTHAHMWPNWGLHKSQVWMYLVNLAYGVTTTRDPQTATTDVLTYSDKVETGELIGPRVYSTGPGVFSGERWRDADHVRDVMKRYSEYYKTNTIKMYMAGNRQQRQWIINAAREQRIMPTTEGGLDLEYNLTMAVDGYPGQEHNLPIYPLYEDVVQLFAQQRLVYTPTLLVTYGGPFGENYYYAKENPYDDPKMQRFWPYNELAAKARRRGQGGGGSPGPGGWFRDEEYAFQGHAEVLNRIVEAGGRGGVGSHGQLDGIGYHWELWQIASGGMSPMNALRVATIHGAEGIGMGNDLGSIEVGKMADLVILSANPLDDIRNTSAISHVMKNGRLYNGDTLTEEWPRQRELGSMYWDGSYDPDAGAGLR
ncbi:MAG: amidohydrolase family protein [Acidobacteria bacterium]|nr:amidohydrolase family protein [Acidobacteriota bacterium]